GTSMNEAKEDMLARIRQALAHSPREEQAISRTYRAVAEDTRENIIEAFAKHVVEYRAILERIEEEQLPISIVEACKQYNVKRLVAPVDIPDSWLPRDVQVVRDDLLLNYADLDAADGVVTGCRLAIAQTGTIVLDGGARQGRRALSLVPDLHFCVV